MNNTAVNMAAVVASSSFYNGGNWGFVLENNSEYDGIMGVFNSEPTIKKIKVNNGYIVFCDYNYLLESIRRVEQVSQETMNKYSNRLNTEVPEFQKFLTEVLRGTSKYMEDCGSYVEYNIGLYSCNNLHKVRVNGIEYPAFSLTLQEALKEIIKLRDKMTIYANTQDGFFELNQLLSQKNMSVFYNGMDIANSTNAVFLTIRISK